MNDVVMKNKNKWINAKLSKSYVWQSDVISFLLFKKKWEQDRSKEEIQKKKYLQWKFCQNENNNKFQSENSLNLFIHDIFCMPSSYKQYSHTRD